jgi:short-subunit dehydrogenase
MSTNLMETPHSPIIIDGIECKMNIETATAFYLAKKGINVIMVLRTKENLAKIKEALVKSGCKESLLSFISADLTTKEGADYLINNLPNNRHFYWVQ